MREKGEFSPALRIDGELTCSDLDTSTDDPTPPNSMVLTPAWNLLNQTFECEPLEQMRASILLTLRPSGLPLVRFHIHLAAAETHAFGFEPESLFYGGIAAQLDFAPGAEHPLPGKSKAMSEDRCDLPCCSRKSGCSSYAAIGRNLPTRDRSDGSLDTETQVRACVVRRSLVRLLSRNHRQGYSRDLWLLAGQRPYLHAPGDNGSILNRSPVKRPLLYGMIRALHTRSCGRRRPSGAW